jgi:hypothetical protein
MRSAPVATEYRSARHDLPPIFVEILKTPSIPSFGIEELPAQRNW